MKRRLRTGDHLRWRAGHPASLAVLFGAIAAFFVARRVAAYGDFASKPLWAAETAVFLVVLLAYLTRVDPRERAAGVREVLVPIVGALLPFALLLTAPRADHAPAAFWAMTAGTALTVWGIATLRRSFSIAVEARELVTGGPYRFVRHPVYAGEIVTALAVAAWRWSWTNAMIAALFVAIQLVRARAEEAKLARALPGYAAFARGAPWLWRAPDG